MFTVFKRLRDKTPPRIPPHYNYVKTNIKRNTEYIIKYWQRMNWVVPSNHILVGIIAELGSISNNPLDIYESVRNNHNHILSVRGIVNSVHYGKLYKHGYFYGRDCEELYIETAFDDSIEQIFNLHYSRWEPIRVMSHPFTSLDHQLPNGKLRKSGEKGMCIIKMDLGLLFAQYCMWKNDITASRYEDGTFKNVMNFIHSYPITNMLRSHNEIVWYNRLIGKYLGHYVSDIDVDNRIGIATSYTNVDDVHLKLIENIEKGVVDFTHILSEIPGIYSKNLITFLKQDNVLLTQQMKLPYCLFLLPYIKWLTVLELNLGTGGNRQFISDIIKKDKEYYNSKTYGVIKGLPFKELYTDIQDNIISLLKTI